MRIPILSFSIEMTPLGKELSRGTEHLCRLGLLPLPFRRITSIHQQQSFMMPGMKNHCYYYHPVVMAVAQYLQPLMPLILVRVD